MLKCSREAHPASWWTMTTALKLMTAEELMLLPDLVVEIKSPSDTSRMVVERARMWLDFGSREVWYGDPERTSVARYRPGEEPEVLGEDDLLDGGDLLPSFSIPVWRLFRRHR